jgi:hypothetical protein
MTQKVFELLKACCASKGENDYVFTRENGVRVKDFRGAWESVTKAAGVPSLLVHDLRRTGARNLRRAGCSPRHRYADWRPEDGQCFPPLQHC